MRGIRQVGLTGRLLVLGVATVLMATIASGYVLRGRVHEAVVHGMEATLQDRTWRLIARLVPEPEGPLRLMSSAHGDAFSEIFSGWYWQIETAGGIERSRSLWDSQLDTREAATFHGHPPLLRIIGPRGEHLVGLRTVLSEQDAVLYLFGPAHGIERDLARLDQALWITLAALLTVLLLAAWTQVQLGLRPLRQLHVALLRVRTGQVDRIGSGFGPDLDPLAAEIDEVLARNARIMIRARGNAADLSHALKKPLALLSAEAGSTHVRADWVRTQVAAMSRLINRHLSRTASGDGVRQRLGIAARIEAMVEMMRKLHASRDVEWVVNVAPDLHWLGEPTDLDEMLGNLLDNAGKWASSRVLVTAAPILPAGVRIDVADDGPGIEDTAIVDAMRRGTRYDEQSSESGLGLSIVFDIAESYHGSLELQHGDTGGLKAVLTLPD